MKKLKDNSPAPVTKPAPRKRFRMPEVIYRRPMRDRDLPEGFHHLPPDEYNREDSKENR